MKAEKILVKDACYHINAKLYVALRIINKADNIIAANIKVLGDTTFKIRPYLQLHEMDKKATLAHILKICLLNNPRPGIINS